MEKVKTYIEALDNALNGGIPAQNTILISGGPGTGKSTLSMQFLMNGAVNNGENVIYFTMTEPELKLVSNMKEFSFFSANPDAQNNLMVIDLRTIDMNGSASDPIKVNKKLNDPNAILEFIATQLNQFNPKRIVIDSITAICNNFDNENVTRQFLFQLGNLLVTKECTSLLISEVSRMNACCSNYAVEEFLADGLINISYSEDKNRLLKTLQIIKMRGTYHSNEKMIVNIDNEGVKLLQLMSEE